MGKASKANSTKKAKRNTKSERQNGRRTQQQQREKKEAVIRWNRQMRSKARRESASGTEAERR